MNTIVSYLDNCRGAKCGWRCTHQLLILVILLLSHVPAFAQKTQPVAGNSQKQEIPEYDETSVFINVQRVGGLEIPAVMRDRTLYLPVTTVFDFLKIKNQTSTTYDSVFGYYINQKALYYIDNRNDQIVYKGEVFQLSSSDLIQTESGLYLNQEYFNRVFGLTTVFDFSNMLVKMNTTDDLPIVKEMQLKQAHQNLSKLKGEVKADTNIGRSYPLFNLGYLDWYLNAVQQSDGQNDLRGGVSLGTVIAGGEANFYLNFAKGQPFKERQQFYQWRFANNSLKALRQVTLGRISPNSVASIYHPVIGAQVTNAPTTYRKSAGSYRLSRTTQPGWSVELYVNNTLVDFAKADASGYFSFDVPLVYGTSVVKLRFYGPYGEEISSEENISIPFNFLPRGELEYSVAAGMVEDSLNSRFARANVTYGVSHKMSFSAGTEYLSSLGGSPAIPYTLASLRLAPGLLLSAEYTHGVRGRGMLTYRMPGNVQAELSYTRYTTGQEAVAYSYKDERKFTVSTPFQKGTLSGVTRLMLNQFLITEHTSYTSGEWLVSGVYRGLSANLSTFLVATTQQDPQQFDPYIYTSASLAYYWKGFKISPQGQYSFKDKSFMSVRFDMERFVFGRGFLNFSYEQNFKSDIRSFSAGFRFDLKYARVATSARYLSDVTVLSEAATGSLIFDRHSRHISTGNRPSIGRAGVTLAPFLDLNGNGRRDKGEQRVAGLQVRITGGRVVYSNTDTAVRIYDLEPYTSYFVDISQNTFENVGWQLKLRSLNLSIDPNQMKLIDLPVQVTSEASGTVSRNGRGQGRISMCFYREDGSRAACVLTDADGYFNYMGLTPGVYTVKPDEAQMTSLHLSPVPSSRTITVTVSKESGLYERNDFTLVPDGK